MTADPDEARQRGGADLRRWRQSASGSAFAADTVLRHLLQRLLGERYGAAAARLEAVAATLGPDLDELVLEASRDENLPRLRRHGSFGEPLEEVVFHPAYHEVGRRFWASGVLSVLAEPGNEVLAGAIAYLLDQQGEAGHACPVACTAGAIKLLQRHGSPEQRQRYLPGLLEADYDRRLHAAQLVTELQGGSDVGANACVAEPVEGRPGWYRLRGEKWFCSVADAGLLVVSARPLGAPAGTRGLGLFLVPRRQDGAVNGFALRRLKWKLGTRSMPTGEIELDGALGEAVGPLEDGFRNLVGIVLDTSRVHNAVAACGLMRRAQVEARAFARSRTAFGQPIVDYPAVQETLARMKLRTTVALATTLRLLAMTDRLDLGEGDATLAAARRIGVMVNKYWTAIQATASARDGIEVLGGNGTVEDFSVLPRLYRDAIVIESWEGTHNTLCAQVLRDFVSRGLHRPWLEVARAEVEALRHPQVASEAAQARSMLAEVERRVDRLVSLDPLEAQARVRHVVDRMCRLTDWTALTAMAQGEHERALPGKAVEVLDLYRLTVIERADPEESAELRAACRRLA